SSKQSRVAAASEGLGAGVEAALPANASKRGQTVDVYSVSCPSPGNCSAVGGYVDRLGNGEGLLLTETAGSWAAGVEAALPADAATTGQRVSIDSVSCASAGSCSAVGTYYDSSGNIEGLLLTESAGSWTAGVEAALPADAAPSQGV